MVRLCRLPCKSKLSSWHHEQAVLHSATSEICVRLQVRERLSLLVPTGRSDWGKLLLGVSTPSCTSAHGAVDRRHSVQEALLLSMQGPPRWDPLAKIQHKLHMTNSESEMGSLAANANRLKSQTNPTGRSLGAGQNACMVRLRWLPCKSKLSSWHHEQAVLHSATSEICVRLQVRERLSLLLPTGRSDWGKLLLGVSTPSCTSAHGAVDRGHSVQEALLTSMQGPPSKALWCAWHAKPPNL